jgi:hypothetical protein
VLGTSSQEGRSDRENFKMRPWGMAQVVECLPSK